MRTDGALFLALVIGFVDVVNSVPHEFCLEPFDGGDCGEPPVPVFYYYKSASRCEIQMWRGCPTLNKFTDQFHCSHLCIGPLWWQFRLESLEIKDMEPLVIKEEWVEEVKALPLEEMKVMDHILHEVMEEIPQPRVTHHREALHYIIQPTTEAETETEPTQVPDSSNEEIFVP